MIPTATYRIQFRNGMTFDRAAALVPYLKRLGISHLYASPVFTATTGSTHGYDVTDANEIDPAIGGRDGFDRMVAGLKAEGLGLILDIVPNHMAASLENPWWRDVIEHGARSRYARHFDIDWQRRLTLPFLGDTFETVLDAGDISVKSDPQTGRPALAYYDSFYPLDPDTYSGREDEILATTDSHAIAALHDLQPYRLMSWRDAPRELSYRRFFEITGLAGVRVEDDQVFEETHRLILDLVRSGAVDGLRVDHVDGLADPKAYLERLRREAGPDCYITVEKILGEAEEISPDWPISGTTGYEFISSLSDALVDDGGVKRLHHAYAVMTGGAPDMAEELRAAELLMADNNFAGEFGALVKAAEIVCEALPEIRSVSGDHIRAGLRELLAAFPVYRTYGNRDGMPPSGKKMLQQVIDHLRQNRPAADLVALPLLVKILHGDVPAPLAEKAATFRTRFQQLTGPLMAKSVEDTLFFRHYALIGLNEVGAEPLPRDYGLDRFHEQMAARQTHQPDAISTTSTHDTKRGEDARARLYALSEAPEVWADAVTHWRGLNAHAVQELDDGPAPEPAVEWMLYQALLGVWPDDLTADDEPGLKALEERFLRFVEKALREAKLRTNWSDVQPDYEQAVQDYARHILSPQNREFLDDFSETVRPFMRAGSINSLTQTLIKLAAPGVPDIYQGSETSDLSLVDPDNRREPDFDALASGRLDEQKIDAADEAAWRDGRIKQAVIARLLELRRGLPDLFRSGDYLPLQATGTMSENIIAFARHHDGKVLLVVLPRLTLHATDPAAPIAGRDWQDTALALSSPLAGLRYRNLFDDGETETSENAAIVDLLGNRPFAVLLSG